MGRERGEVYRGVKGGGGRGEQEKPKNKKKLLDSVNDNFKPKKR